MPSLVVVATILVLGVIGVGTGVVALYYFRQLRRYLGIPISALHASEPPKALLEQPCELRYLQDENGTQAVLVAPDDADVQLGHYELAEIQAYVGAESYEVTTPHGGFGLEIRFNLSRGVATPQHDAPGNQELRQPRQEA